MFVCHHLRTHLPPDNSAYARYAVRGGIAFLLNASVHWLWLRVWLWVWEWVC